MIAVLLLTLLLPSTVLAVTLPTLPTAQVNVTMPTVTGSTLNATCATLQAQINAAAALDVNLTHKIVLALGTTCMGPYRLPSHTGGTGWIIITGPNESSFPVGIRVSASQASLMPTIQYGEQDMGSYTDVGMFSALTGAQRYRIIGINMVQNSSFNPNHAFVITGYNNQNALNTGHIILDRVIMRDTNTTHETIRAIFADAQLGHIALINSYIDGIQDVGNNDDTQAFLAISNPGPILVENNYLEASGENLMIGGGDPASESVMPKDITIKRNTFKKKPQWHGTGNNLTKTLLELKLGLRILIEGNDFLDMPWNDMGYAFRLTPRNQDNGAPYSEVSDLTIRYNLGKNVTNWIFSMGSDSDFTSKHSKRWHIHDNLVYGLGWLCGGGATCGAFFSVDPGGSTCTDPTPSCKLQDLTIAHNTVDDASAWILYVDQPGQNGFDFRDNLIHANGGRGAFSETLWGTAFLDSRFSTTYTWTNNTIASIGGGESTSLYPQGTNSYPANVSDILWTNRLLRDYSLQVTSPAKLTASDGIDRGVNFVAYNTARSSVVVSTPTGKRQFMPFPF